MSRAVTPREKELSRERVRRWNEAHPGRKKELDRLYYQRNRETIIARSAQWAKDHPERAAELSRQGAKRWAQRNPEKVREQTRLRDNHARYMRNREHERARLEQWATDNPERRREGRERWLKANVERKRETNRLWRLANPARAQVHVRSRRARKRGAAGSHTPEDVAARFAFHGNRCVYCGATGRLAVDHMIPLSRGGSNWAANLVPACKPCNSTKGTRTFREFRAA